MPSKQPPNRDAGRPASPDPIWKAWLQRAARRRPAVEIDPERVFPGTTEAIRKAPEELARLKAERQANEGEEQP